MKRSRASFVIFSSLVLLCFGARASAQTLEIDPVHSFIVFDIHHFGAGYVYGTFAGPKGTVEYDANDLSKIKFDAQTSADSISTQNSMRDRDLKGPDFFNVRQFPTIAFVSTSAEKTGDNTIKLTGNLTLKGVTKPVTVTMERTGTGKGGMRNETRVGFRTTFTIKRSDFDMTYDAPAIGDEVELIVAIEAIER